LECIWRSLCEVFKINILKDEKNILVLIFGHPEYYPPTLNAIDELSNAFNKITILYRPFLNNKWKYRDNVNLIASGKKIDVKQQEKSTILKKIFFHLQFVIKLFRLIISKKYDTILVYDYLPMLSLYLVSPFLSKKVKLWYHNHDPVFLKDVKIYSIGWFAIHAQNKLMKRLDFFSLPAIERLNYFSISEKTKVFIIPNYPAKKRYGVIDTTIKNYNNIHLVYQGTIGEGHGLEAINKVINSSDQMADYRLTVIGNIIEEFKLKLEQLNLNRYINYLGFVPYHKLPSITAQSHIGIAVNIPSEVIYQTGGTASNKIYEYAACGLPILYFDHPHYREYLGQFKWAFATDLSKESIENCIIEIMNNYDYFSQQARNDFLSRLNFESVFEPILKTFNESE
jgi:hypothetical protein